MGLFLCDPWGECPKIPESWPLRANLEDWTVISSIFFNNEALAPFIWGNMPSRREYLSSKDFTVSSISASFADFLGAKLIDEVFSPECSNNNAAVYCLITREKREWEGEKEETSKNREKETELEREQQKYILFLNWIIPRTQPVYIQAWLNLHNKLSRQNTKRLKPTNQNRKLTIN